MFTGDRLSIIQRQIIKLILLSILLAPFLLLFIVCNMMHMHAHWPTLLEWGSLCSLAWLKFHWCQIHLLVQNNFGQFKIIFNSVNYIWPWSIILSIVAQHANPTFEHTWLQLIMVKIFGNSNRIECFKHTNRLGIYSWIVSTQGFGKVKRAENRIDKYNCCI